jgi:Domain of unknown function (DUF4476)
MKQLRLFFVISINLIVLNLGLAQNQSFDDFNSSRNARRQARRCTEPFATRSFNRDYAGLSATNYYHLEKELKDYVKFRCLTSEQVRRLAINFPTDREKYDFLIYSFTYVFDIENYAMTGTVMANRNARDAFYRFLVREGVPAGDYYTDPFAGGYAYNGVVAPPQYYANANALVPQQNGNNPNGFNNNGNNFNSNNPYDNYHQNNQNGNNQNGNNLNNNPNNNQNGNYNNPNANNNGSLNAGPQGIMSYKEFEALKARIRQNTFDRKRVETAKTLTRQSVLTSNQIVEIVQLITSDNNRLEFAKFAYDYVSDRENYSIVVETMAFEGSKKDLQRYLDANRKR